MTPLALIAGEGRLPELVAGHLQATGRPFRVFAMAGHAPAGLSAESFAVEGLGSFLDRLRRDGVTEICLAGGVRRPEIDPARIDARTLPLVPRLTQAMAGGDDALLRTLLAIGAEHGLAFLGAHEVMPSLLAAPGTLGAHAADAAALADAARGRAILDALSPVDVGQAAVVAGGLCLGIETVQGTAAMLRHVGATRGPVGGTTGGVLVKRPKVGQEIRVDLPAIGPDTVDQAEAAGLTGIAIAARGTLVLDRAEVIARADAAGIALWAEP